MDLLISLRKSVAVLPQQLAQRPRLCGMRAIICSFVSRSVSETLIVRSNGNRPWWTFSKRVDGGLHGIIAAEHRSAKTLARHFDLLRQRDFLFAVNSGISAICDRYIRIGSSLSLGS